VIAQAAQSWRHAVSAAVRRSVVGVEAAREVRCAFEVSLNIGETVSHGCLLHAQEF